ncbi:MAG TPA: S8 family serine peptidase [Vicinamibacterales bacterium]|nr:S8 family serine peptidase [Vicinamibacterales bacterium]
MRDFPATLRHGSGVDVKLDPSRALLIFSRPHARRELEETLTRHGLVLEAKDSDGPDVLGELVNDTDTHYWVRSSSGKAIEDKVHDRIETALGRNLICISPVYCAPRTSGRGGCFSPLANVVLIKPAHHAGHQPTQPLEVAERLGLKEIPEKSRHLAGYHYFNVANPRREHAFKVREKVLAELPGAEVQFEHMPMLVPVAAVPNDPLFFRQWDMSQIEAPAGWDISTGVGAVVCILDQGCDLTHPDLSFSSPGINLGTMAPPGSPTGPHGTCCAGIAAGVINDAIGVAGVAGGAKILPVAFQNWTDVECAIGINWASGHGARVISMSFGVYAPGDGFGPTGWNFAIIDPAIANAVNVLGVVLCAATGNENTPSINRYPARHPLVIACGGSDQSDNRKRPASPDGECWGANFGPGISVVAPAVLCTTTDIQGAGGYNASGGPISVPCVTYPVGGDTAGNYFFEFNGTSAATPHLAGFATLLAAAYPALTNLEIRRIIERTAAKVGTGAYSDVPGFANGTRTPELGYGRINVFHGLDFADVMIRDWPGDNGVEPSTPPGGNFTDFSDLVVRPHGDGVFIPTSPALSSHVHDGRRNHIYVRAHNAGPHTARNVVVNVRLTPDTGSPFVYPADWTVTDATHVRPKPVHHIFPSIPAGGSVIAEFVLAEHHVDAMEKWAAGGSRPCLLGVVTADNDYAFASAPGGPNLVRARNNLAERALTMVAADERHEEEVEREEREAREKGEHPEVELTLSVKVNGKETTIRHR